MKIDLFGGTGFIGSFFKGKYENEVYVHPREDNIPIHENILYMISTTHNYHVFEDVLKDVNTNLVKLLLVLENCKNKNVVFNFISSWFVYGEVDLPAKEDSCCNPKGFYSITKKCAEDLIISFCQTYNIKYRILRLCNVYGLSDKGVSKQKNALQYLIKEIKNNNEVKLYYDGDFIRDYMHVEDVCDAIYLIINRLEKNQIINIGSGETIKFKKIIEFAIKETKSKSIIIPIDATEFHKTIQVKNMVLDVSKLKKLGFVKKINIFDGIKEML